MTPPIASGPERLYCLAHCQHREHRPNGEACRTACPLDLPYIVRGEDGIEFHIEGETHLISPGDITQHLLCDDLMIHLYRLGAEVQEKGKLLPTREEVFTGNVYPDQDGYVRIRLYGKDLRAWVTIGTWLEAVVQAKRPLCPVREIFEGVRG